MEELYSGLNVTLLMLNTKTFCISLTTICIISSTLLHTIYDLYAFMIYDLLFYYILVTNTAIFYNIKKWKDGNSRNHNIIAREASRQKDSSNTMERYLLLALSCWWVYVLACFLTFVTFTSPTLNNKNKLLKTYFPLLFP